MKSKPNRALDDEPALGGPDADAPKALLGEGEQRAPGIIGGLVLFFCGPPLPQDKPGSCSKLILREAHASPSVLGGARRAREGQVAAGGCDDKSQGSKSIFSAVWRFFFPPAKTEAPLD